jgi:leucyl-tRNA synthetase
MSEHRYDPSEIEPRWQALWAAERTWEVANLEEGESPTAARTNEPPSSYVLEMLPYPSGEPHIGHLKCYSLGDAIAHFHRRLGKRVLHPMGYDAFGLPAENHAIRTGVHPRVSTAESIAEFQRQFREWGISIDWSRELATSEPTYYRWTQWIFLELFKAGLAYRREAAVKWCPNDQTVLANEQVDAEGRCASAAATWSKCASSSSGSCASPTTPSGCSPTSTRSTGPSTSRRCSATGSGAARARR